MATKLNTLKFKTLTYRGPLAVGMAYHLKKEEYDNNITYYLQNLQAEVNMRLLNNRGMVETMEYTTNLNFRNEALHYFQGQVRRLEYVAYLITQAQEKQELQREVRKGMLKTMTKT